MNAKWMAMGGATVAALALIVGMAGSAQAQTPGPTPQGRGPRTGQMPAMGAGLRMGGPQASLVSVAANTLGMTQVDLVAQLQANKTIADVAAEKNVAPAAIVDAFVAPRVTQLNAAVAAGTITQAQADAMIAAMRANVTAQLSQPWTARGPGNGTPRGDFVDANGDGVCDEMPANGQGGMRGPRTNSTAPGTQRGPRR